jgi:hypothetical protein
MWVMNAPPQRAPISGEAYQIQSFETWRRILAPPRRLLEKVDTRAPRPMRARVSASSTATLPIGIPGTGMWRLSPPEASDFRSVPAPLVVSGAIVGPPFIVEANGKRTA